MIGEALEEKVLKPTNLKGSRWVPYIFKAVKVSIASDNRYQATSKRLLCSSTLTVKQKCKSVVNVLNLWGQCWGMRFNTKKCQVMHIGKQNRHHFYQLNNEILTTATELKYLGITLTNDLKWSTHVKQTSTKAHQRLGFVKRNLKGSPYKHREMAYTSLVRSPMEYCGAIWDPVLKRDVDKLERVQRQGARWAKGVHGIVSVSGILRELGWKELASRRKEQRLTMLHKILHGEMAIPHDAVNIKHMQRSRSHSMALVRPVLASPHHHFGHAQYLHPSKIGTSCHQWWLRPGP